MSALRRLVGVSLLLVASMLEAEVSVPAVFSDHAVLQRASRVPIWGKAAAGEEISVKLGGAVAKARAGGDGAWQAQLDLSQSSPGPHLLEVKGGNTITVRDVMVGEVWLASGQSNMEWLVTNTTGAREVIERSANPAIRHFRVEKNASPRPQDELRGKWEVAAPTTTGSLSATAYFFARSIYEALNVPVGVINSSWGGTPVESWTSQQGISRDSALKASAEKYQSDEQRFPSVLRTYQATWTEWAGHFGRTEPPPSAVPPEQPWSAVTLESRGTDPLPSAGAVWLRKSFVVSAAEARIQQPVTIGSIEGFYTVYFNGEKIAEVKPATGRPFSNTIYVSGEIIRPGNTVLAVRIFNPAGTPTIRGDPPLRFNGRALAGEWEFHVERSLPPISEAARAAMPPAPVQPLNRQNIAGYLYNGMIAPLVPYCIKGVIWYQGESNTGRAWQYRTAFPLLIRDWRGAWGAEDLPFYFCQLANFGEKRSVPGENNWAELRDAQATALGLPHTGQAVLIDVGEADDVHAREKQVVGARLAALALARTYRRDRESSGPVYTKMTVEGGAIRLQFTHADGGLVDRALPETYQPRSTVDRRVPLLRNSPDSNLEGFAICGEDRRWVWAQAKIEGATVVVSSPSVNAPVAVRYAWAANPTCNLYNRSGLPASPFRTDDFPLTTRAAKY